MFAVVGAVTWLVARPRLPDPVATHWGEGLMPDGNMPFWVIFSVTVGAMVLVTIELLIGRRTTGETTLMLSATCWVIDGVLLGAIVATVLANLDVAVWSDADAFDAWDIALVVVPGLVLGGVGFLIAGGPKAMATPPLEEGKRPSAGLAVGERGVWSGSGGSRALAAVGALCLVGAVISGFLVGGWVSLGLVAVSVALLLFASVRVTVSSHGVVIGLGWWAWPAKRIPLPDLVAAEVIDVDPMAFGGWGYRIRPGARGYILRRGPGIRLVRPDAADIVVTVDDAGTGAGLINDLLARPGDRAADA